MVDLRRVVSARWRAIGTAALAGAVVATLFVVPALGAPPTDECGDPAWNGEYWKGQIDDTEFLVTGVETSSGILPGDISLSFAGNGSKRQVTWTNSTDYGVFRIYEKYGRIQDQINNAPLENPFEIAKSISHITFCFSEQPDVDIVKKTNDTVVEVSAAGTSPLFIPVDDVITWTYEVTNIGNVPLENVAVDDDQLTADPAFASGDINTNGVLDVGETWTYIAGGTSTDVAVAGTWLGGSTPYDGYVNTGTVTADSAFDGTTVTASDSSGYYGSNPAIVIDVTDPGTVQVGDPVTWIFDVENTGNVPLDAVVAKELIVDGSTADLACQPLDSAGQPVGDALDPCLLGNMVPGDTAKVSYTETAVVGGDVTKTFVVQGTDPVDMVQSDDSGDVGYSLNSPPTPQDDSYSMNERFVDTTGAVALNDLDTVRDFLDGVLINDTDPDGDTLTASTSPDPLVTNLGATVDLASDGSFTYSPVLKSAADWEAFEEDANDATGRFAYTDTWQYTVDDGNGATATATVSVTVNRVICSDDTVRGEDPNNPNFYGEFTLLPDESGVVQCKEYSVSASESDNVVILDVPAGQGDPVFFSGVLSGPTETPSQTEGSFGAVTFGLEYDRDLGGPLDFEPLLACDGTPTVNADGIVEGAVLPSSDNIPAGTTDETWCLAAIVAPAVNGVLVPLHYVYGTEDPGFSWR